MNVEIIECKGQGLPILLIHCSGLGARQFKLMTHAFKKRQVFVPNLSGYGKTDPYIGPEGKSWEVDFQIVESVVSSCQQINVFGHSYGGFLALMAAKKYPKRIKRLCMHEPVAWGSLRSKGETSLIDGFNTGVEQLFQQKLSNFEWCRRFIDFWNGFGSWSELNEKRKNEWLLMTPKVKDEVKGLCDDATPHDHWKSIKAKTLITMGVESPLSQRAVCTILKETLQDVTLKEVPGGHMAPLTHPKGCLPLHVEALLNDN